MIFGCILRDKFVPVLLICCLCCCSSPRLVQFFAGLWFCCVGSAMECNINVHKLAPAKAKYNCYSKIQLYGLFLFCTAGRQLVADLACCTSTKYWICMILDAVLFNSLVYGDTFSVVVISAIYTLPHKWHAQVAVNVTTNVDCLKFFWNAV